MLVLVAGVALAGAYLALNPPPVAEVALPQGRRAAHRWEWAVPLGVVVALFVGFLVAQATAMWGGHDYLQRTTGLSYAEYVHQGFGQLTVATFLTVVVVGLTMRRASRATPRDRLLLRLLLGALCVLTLAVVASALYRMSLYQEAFGYTVLRVFVDGFELWLGLVVVFLLVAGVQAVRPVGAAGGARLGRGVRARLRGDEPRRVGGRAQHRPLRRGRAARHPLPEHPVGRRDPGHRAAAAGRRGRVRAWATAPPAGWTVPT